MDRESGRPRTRQKAIIDAPATQSPAQRTRDEPDNATTTALQQRYGGDRLTPDTRSRFERSYGVSLDHVRVHSDDVAQRHTSRLGVPAFAVGRNIYVDRGTFTPATTGGQRLLAHETAHVVQQRRGGPGGPNGREDPVEREADRAADVALSGGTIALREKAAPRVLRAPHEENRVGHGRSGMQSKKGTTSTPYYDEKTGYTAKDWVFVHGIDLYVKLAVRLRDSGVRLGSPYLSWRPSGETSFASNVLLKMLEKGSSLSPLAATWWGMLACLAPDNPVSAVDVGRDNYPHFYGPKDWQDGVLDEVFLLLKKRVDESMQRIAARYVDVKNQHLLRVERKQPGASADVPADEMFLAHPMDTCVLDGLEKGATVDTVWYRKAFPEKGEIAEIKTVKPVNLVFGGYLKPQYVVADRADATAAEVAAELYGETTSAYALIDQHPVFRFDVDTATQFRMPYKLKLLRVLRGDDKLVEEDLGAIQRQHARDITPTPGLEANEQGKQVVMARWEDISRFLGDCEQRLLKIDLKAQSAQIPFVAKWFAKKKKENDFQYQVISKNHDPKDVTVYDQITTFQRDAVLNIKKGVFSSCALAEAYSSWPRVDDIMSEVIRRFGLVVLSLDWVGLAKEALATADRSLKVAPADILDAMLAQLRRMTYQAMEDKTGLFGTRDLYGTGDLLAKETKLRTEVFKLRDILLTNPDAAQKELERLIKELTTLQTGVAIVANMDGIDSAWKALYDSLSTIGVITGGNSRRSDGMTALHKIHKKWSDIYGKWQSGDDKKKQEASDELKALSEDKEWKATYDKVRDILESEEQIEFWVSFGIMIGLAIVTAGIGTLVYAGVEAAYGVYWAFAIATLTEASYMTLMTTLLFDKDPSFGSVSLNFVKNLFTFAVLRGIGLAWGPQAGMSKAAVTAAEVKVLLIQFAATWFMQIGEAEAIKYYKTGQHLTLEEVCTMTLENIAFTVAIMVGTKLAKPGLESMQIAGTKFGTGWKIRSLRGEIADTTTRLKASAGKDPAIYDELLAKQGELLRLEDAALSKMEALSTDPKTSGHFSATEIKKLSDLRAEWSAGAMSFRRARLFRVMTAIGEDAVGVPKGAMFDEARSFFEELNKETGKKPVDNTADPGTGARSFNVEVEGKQVTVVERMAPAEMIGQAPIVRVAPTLEEVTANQASADTARVTDSARRAEVKKLVDAETEPTFKRIIIGGGYTGVTDAATLPAGAGTKLTGGPVTTLPEVIVVQANAEPWSTRGNIPAGQRPGELDSPVMRVSDYAADQQAYAPSKAIGDAIAVARVRYGVATYEGAATGTVEIEPTPGAWSKPARVMINGKYWYADAIHLDTGLGPPRKLGTSQLSTANESTLAGDGRLVYGDTHLASVSPSAKEVLVTGGSATAGWNAEAAAKSGASKVYWVHRPSAPEAGTKYADDLAAFDKKLGEPGLDSIDRMIYEQRKADILSFRRAMLPRNTEPADAAFKNPKIERSSGTIKKVEPVEEGGLKRVKVTLDDGRVMVVDQIVVSIGQDPAAAGGPKALAGSHQFRMVKNASGELVELESVDPPGAVRIRGPAMAEPTMRDVVVPTERAEFAALLAQRAGDLPDNSRGVAGSIALSGRTVPESNQMLAANDAMKAAGMKLPGATRTLALRPGEEAQWPKQISEFVARELGVDPSRVVVLELGGGRSGANVYKVKLGDADVGVFKVFSDPADAAAELNAIDTLAKKHLKDLNVVGNKGDVGVDVGGAKRGGILMETAQGRTVKQMLEALPESGPVREQALHDLAEAARRVGQALAEFHKSFETGREMTRAQKKSEAVYMLTKLEKLRPLLDPAAYEAISQRALEVSVDFLESHVPETAYLGDANLGNFAIGAGGKVTTFDVGTMKWSLDASGAGKSTGAADIARFANSFVTEFPGKLSPSEAKSMQTAFGEAYLKASGMKSFEGMWQATKFYQLDMEIGIALGQQKAGAPIADPLGRLLDMLKLPAATKFRSDADLALDADPTPRPKETADQALARADAAKTEQTTRANEAAAAAAAAKEEEAPPTPKKKRPTWPQSKKSMSSTTSSSGELEAVLTEKQTEGFSADDVGALRRWGKALARVLKSMLLSAKDFVGDLEPGYSRYAYDKARYRLFDAIVKDILQPDADGKPTRPQADQAKLLKDYLGDMPDSASKGSINSKYRAGRFAAKGGDIQTLPGLKKSLADPGNVLGGRARDADGAMSVSKQQSNGGPPDGTYGIDDKAGKSFDPVQASDVSKLAESKDGLSMGGQKLDGYIYWCEDAGHAESLARKLNSAGLSPKLRVAYIDDAGAIKWER